MPTDIHAERILIIDFGSQYTQLIARRVRDLGVYCEIFPYTVDENTIEDFSPSGIILSGGPETVTAEDTPRAAEFIFEIGCPVLGICYGMQTMAMQLGGEVEAAKHREFGYAQIVVQNTSRLLEGIEDSINHQGQVVLDIWMSHGDHVVKLPENFQVIASSESCGIAAMSDEERRYYGVQFHPEVTHSKQGIRILKRFVMNICGCSSVWNTKNIKDNIIKTIKEQVDGEKVLLALSGGVDSSVLATLLHRAIGDKLICVFVDTGLLRIQEASQIMQMLERHFGIQIVQVSAEQRFIAALAGITDPEQKRKIIGKLFIEIFEEEAQKISGIKWLAQGTIYSDVIESAASHNIAAHVIKSHHNVGGLPERMNLKLLEPLRELFKDEVRALGLELGMPHDLIYRHPFPGPGLAVRVLGEVKPEYIDLVRRADAIFIEELHKFDYYHKVSQAFAVFLPVKSVGVMGDARKYEYVISLRAVESVDFMTARWAYLPQLLLETVSNRIINEISGIARVTYDISHKPPATIEWE